MITGMDSRLVYHSSTTEDVMKGAFFRMKEHDEKTKKGKDRHDKKDKPYT